MVIDKKLFRLSSLLICLVMLFSICCSCKGDVADDSSATQSAVDKWIHEADKIIIYEKGDTVFAFNFNPSRSFDGYFIPVSKEGRYKVILSSDDGVFGGHSRADSSAQYQSFKTPAEWVGFNCYLPSRTAIVFKKIK